MCFCSRRVYNIGNAVDIKNLNKFIMRQFVDFKHRIWWYHDWIFFNPTLFSWLILIVSVRIHVQCTYKIIYKSSLRKSYGRHHDDLVERYGISVKILPRICSTCRKHFPVLSSFMTYHRVCNYINTTGATSGAGTTYPSGHPSSPSVFIGVGVTQSLVLCVCFVDRRCLSFCTFFWALCCLFFFDIRILIAPLVTSNSSCTQLPEMIWYRLYLITWFYQLTIQIYTCT